MRKTDEFKRCAICLIAILGVALMTLGAEPQQLALGKVNVDAKARSVSFPAQVNMRSGAIEYFAVHETGKVHESIFKTAVAPQEIHAAALLFSSTNKPGLKVNSIEATWTGEGKEKRFQAAELILDKKNKRALGKTKWAYRGSRLINGTFLAQRDGSIISIQEDRDALIDQDTPDAADDENWEPITDLIPPLDAAVTIVIRFSD